MKVGLGHIDFATHFTDRRHGLAFEFLRHLLHSPDIGGHVLALVAVTARGGSHQVAVFVAQRHESPSILGSAVKAIAWSSFRFRKRRIRSTKSVTSCPENALLRDSIGTACRTFAKP